MTTNTQDSQTASGLRTTAEAAEYLRLSLRSMERLVASRAIAVVHIGRRVLLRQVDLDAFIANHLEAPVRLARGGGRRPAGGR
jgi:excisionase family DNA binding protein